MNSMKTFDPRNKGCYIKFASQPPVIVCDHCGDEEVLELPKKLSELTEEMDRFEAEHEGCKNGNN